MKLEGTICCTSQDKLGKSQTQSLMQLAELVEKTGEASGKKL